MTWASIPGRAAYLWIYDDFLVDAPPNARVVEVGVALGKSVAYLAERCIELGRSDITIYAVDAWAGVARNGEQQALCEPSEDFDLFLGMMRTHSPEALERIVVVKEWSAKAAEKMPFGWLDLVVLDAAHDYISVRHDIEAWRPRVKAGGYMGGDDYEEAFPGVIEACREAFGGAVEVRRESNWGTWRVEL